MEMEKVVKNGKALKFGYTTGSCAAAAAKAAAVALFTGEVQTTVRLKTPKGIALILDIIDMAIQKDRAVCGIVKDAGDDPDITHGLKIYAEVCKTEYHRDQVDDGDKTISISIEGGPGVGKVTKPGLAVAPGNPAINPVPMQMIRQELLAVCKAYAYEGGLVATISVPDGIELAEKTYNPRLGIIGGISILGTSGIVEPMSERALIESIQAEMKVYRENYGEVLVLSPGNYGVDFTRTQLGIDLSRAVKCSNFIGEALDYALYLGFKKVLLIGHAGKLIKLAGGVMNTHSRIADCRMEILTAHLALAGGKAEDLRSVMNSITTEEAVGIIEGSGLLAEVCRSLNEKIMYHLDYRTGKAAVAEYIIFHGQNQLFLQSDNAHGLIQEVLV